MWLTAYYIGASSGGIGRLKPKAIEAKEARLFLRKRSATECSSIQNMPGVVHRSVTGVSSGRRRADESTMSKKKWLIAVG
jgi:hypothetical protein